MELLVRMTGFESATATSRIFPGAVQAFLTLSMAVIKLLIGQHFRPHEKTAVQGHPTQCGTNSGTNRTKIMEPMRIVNALSGTDLALIFIRRLVFGGTRARVSGRQ